MVPGVMAAAGAGAMYSPVDLALWGSAGPAGSVLDPCPCCDPHLSLSQSASCWGWVCFEHWALGGLWTRRPLGSVFCGCWRLGRKRRFFKTSFSEGSACSKLGAAVLGEGRERAANTRCASAWLQRHLRITAHMHAAARRSIVHQTSPPAPVPRFTLAPKHRCEVLVL